MTEHLFKLLAAYSAGTAATAFMVSLVWLAPLPDYAKRLLSWILPLPVILIVLVLLYYGPQSSAAEEAPAGIVRIFLMGALTVFAGCAIVPAVKFVLRLLTASQDDEENPEE